MMQEEFLKIFCKLTERATRRESVYTSMKSFLIFLVCLMAIFSAGTICGQDDKMEIYGHENQWGSTNIWLVSKRALTNAPKWKAGKEPPLSPGKAVKIARKWILAKGAYPNFWIEDVELKPFAPASRTGIYFYDILIGGAGLVGHSQRCIILMDGTIVEPEIRGSKSTHYQPWDFDE